MIKMTKREFGEACLAIHMNRIRRGRIEMSAEEFQERNAKLARCLEVGADELKRYWFKYILPQMANACGDDNSLSSLAERMKNATDCELHIAIRYIEERHFWGLENLRSEVTRISEQIPVADSFEKVAAIAKRVVRRHFDEQFGERDAIDLQIIE